MFDWTFTLSITELMVIIAVAIGTWEMFENGAF